MAAGDCHFSVMTKDSETFVGGPPMVKQALGMTMTKQELGNYKVQAEAAGAIHNVAEDEPDAFDQIRRFLSYLPSNVWQLPPRVEPKDDPNRRDEELLSLIPRDRHRAYDVYQLIESVMDRDSTFEISRLFGRSLVTMLARLDGFPVAVIANDCRYYGGAMTPDACLKYERFVDFANTFHLPVIYFCDIPGFMVGLSSEKQGIIRFANRAMFAAREATIPYVTIVIRRLYGVAGGAAKSNGLGVRYAWPSGRIGIAGRRGWGASGVSARDRGRAGSDRQTQRDRGSVHPRRIGPAPARPGSADGDHRSTRHASRGDRLCASNARRQRAAARPEDPGRYAAVAGLGRPVGDTAPSRPAERRCSTGGGRLRGRRRPPAQ